MKALSRLKRIAPVVFFLVLILPQFAFGQQADLQWQIVGSANGTQNMITDIETDASGNVYTLEAENVSLSTSGTVFLKKHSPVDGVVIWSRAVPLAGAGYTDPVSAIDSTGIYIGYNYPGTPYSYAAVDKIDFNGNLLWRFTDPGLNYFITGPTGIDSDDVGGLYIIGQTNLTDPYPIFQKRDATTGNVIWNAYGENLSYPQGVYPQDVSVNDSKTSVYITSQYGSGYANNLWGWKLERLRTSDGVLEMQTSNTGPVAAVTAVETIGTSIYLGYLNVSTSIYNILRIAENGTILWTKTITPPPSNFVMLLQEGFRANASGLYITYSFMDTGLAYDRIYIEKRDFSGNLVWQEISNPSAGSDFGYALENFGPVIYTGGYVNLVNCGFFCSISQSYLEKRAPSFATTPTAPIITGPTTGIINTLYTFNAQSTDPEGDQVRYGYDWGMDGTVDTWTSLVNSGTQGNSSNQWGTAGAKTFQVLAEDSNGTQSGWSPHTITISAPTQCSDGVNNDGDTWTDYPADPGCANASDNTEGNNPQCSDGINNDADAWIDLADPGCLDKYDTDESDNPQCSDGADNDSDGIADYPGDYGCSNISDNNESDNPQCSDGIDNDGDGTHDHSSTNPTNPDSGCSSPADNTERTFQFNEF